MTITCSKLGKRYSRDWIFKNLDFTVVSNGKYAITGTNGTGKSTLLQLLASSIALSSGAITWSLNGKDIIPEKVFSFTSIAAPYLDLIEELTLQEHLNFHKSLKPFITGYNTKVIINEIGLDKAKNKQIRYFSSGMKQRVKLALAFFSNCPLLLLDEPCTNLDSQGIELYKTLIQKIGSEKTIVVSSNDLHEYDFCDTIFSILPFT